MVRFKRFFYSESPDESGRQTVLTIASNIKWSNGMGNAFVKVGWFLDCHTKNWKKKEHNENALSMMYNGEHSIILTPYEPKNCDYIAFRLLHYVTTQLPGFYVQLVMIDVLEYQLYRSIKRIINTDINNSFDRVIKNQIPGFPTTML